MDARGSYDRVADEYTTRVAGELTHKPFDRARLDDLVARTAGLGPLLALGCGPGHVAAYLAGRGARVTGIDLSPAMIEQARALHPDLDLRVGDITALDVAPEQWGGIACFYAIIHVPRERVTEALDGMRQALAPGGWTLLAYHVGDEIRHLDEWWGRPVDVDFVFFRPGEMESYARAAGFVDITTEEREPYSPEVEAQTQRGYTWARRPLE